jgi:aminoglycoside phosphotransferase family enzyme/predicted kinase
MDASPSSAARIAETHVSMLVFAGDRVFKAKKPVHTGFLDFSTVEARRAACHREVELNRRLAPDVYLGVADVTMDGRELDHVVVMRRLPEERRLTRLLDDAAVDDHLRAIAHQVAAFHEAADRGPAVDAASGHGAVVGLWEAGLEQVAPYVGPVLPDDEAAELALLARAYLAGRRPLLDGRVAEGRACDGHGDLQAEDIFVLADGPRILDCLEFDDRLRYGDVLADVAFLAMDLERLGHPQLGDRFLRRYRELSADSWPDSLAHLHVAYRAHVRAKVACIRHDQGDAAAADAARHLHHLALGHLEAARVHLVLVGGSPGTGKSTVAAELGERLGAVVLSSDDVRDDVVPRSGPAADGLFEGRYRPELVTRVYAELLREAEVLLGHGERVVLDASWLDPARRAEARDLAVRTSSRLTELRCTAPADLVEERIARRRAAGGAASEATAEVARALAADAPPWAEATELDTRDGLGVVAGLAEAVVTRPDPG